MPRYDYICRNDHVFECQYDTIGEAKRVRKCPQCGLNAERQIALSNPVLGLQSGTYKGTKHQEEVKGAMKDFSQGKTSTEKGS